MQWLKFLVIFLGIIILGGLTVLAVTIVSRAPDSTGAKPFEMTKFQLPKGAYIEETNTEKNRLILRLRLEGGGGRILILSLKDGTLLGTIELERQP